VHALPVWRGCKSLGCSEDSLLSCVPAVSQAEADLYAKSSQLVQFLHSWQGSAADIPGRYEELMIELFERGYVEVKVRHCCKLCTWCASECLSSRVVVPSPAETIRTASVSGWPVCSSGAQSFNAQSVAPFARASNKATAPLVF
jgi:hypothetical protein